MGRQKRLKKQRRELQMQGETNYRPEDRIAQLEAENRKLRSELYRALLTKEKETAGASHVIGLADHHRQQYEDEIARLRDLVDELVSCVPIDILATPERDPNDTSGMSEEEATRVKWKNTMVGIVALFRDDAGPEVKKFVAYNVYPGTGQEAFDHFALELAYASNRMPSLADVGNQQLDGVSAWDLLEIFRELTPVRYLQDKDTYVTKRLELFDKYWPQMEATGLYTDRNHARTRFSQIVDRTFETAEKHREQDRSRLKE